MVSSVRQAFLHYLNKEIWNAGEKLRKLEYDSRWKAEVESSHKEFQKYTKHYYINSNLHHLFSDAIYDDSITYEDAIRILNESLVTATDDTTVTVCRKALKKLEKFELELV